MVPSPSKITRTVPPHSPSTPIPQPKVEQRHSLRSYCPSLHPGLTSPEVQGIPEGQILPSPSQYSHQGDPNTGSTLTEVPHLLPKGTSLPLGQPPKPAQDREGQIPEETGDLHKFFTFANAHRTHTRYRITQSTNKQKSGPCPLSIPCKCFSACLFYLSNFFHIPPVPVTSHSARHIVGTQKYLLASRKERKRTNSFIISIQH